jgi:hypothetical protein
MYICIYIYIDRYIYVLKYAHTHTHKRFMSLCMRIQWQHDEQSLHTRMHLPCLLILTNAWPSTCVYSAFCDRQKTPTHKVLRINIETRYLQQGGHHVVPAHSCGNHEHRKFVFIALIDVMPQPQSCFQLAQFPAEQSVVQANRRSALHTDTPWAYGELETVSRLAAVHIFSMLPTE